MAKGYILRMLAEGERILVITRQHWFVVASAIFFESVVIVISIIALILGVGVSHASQMVKLIISLACMGIIVITGISMLRDYLIWWNKQYMITSLRVIQISGVINKSLTDSSLEKVNDVKLVQSIIGRVFDYGNVEILTASEAGVNLFRRIGNPVGFKTAMVNAKQDLERNSGGSGKGREDVPSMIGQLDQLHKQGVLTDEEFARKKQELLAKM